MIHFWDLTQIRQLTQSDSIILILYVDDKKKPQNGLLKASRPPPRGCCLVGRTVVLQHPPIENVGRIVTRNARDTTDSPGVVSFTNGRAISMPFGLSELYIHVLL